MVHEPTLSEMIRGGLLRADEPENLSAEWKDGAVIVHWTGPGSDAKDFRVYRRDSPADPWRQIGTVPVNDRAIGAFSFVDREVVPAVPYEYAVDTTNINGQVSQLRVTKVSAPSSLVP